MGLSPTGKSASIAAQALSSSASCRFIPAHCNGDFTTTIPIWTVLPSMLSSLIRPSDRLHGQCSSFQISVHFHLILHVLQELISVALQLVYVVSDYEHDIVTFTDGVDGPCPSRISLVYRRVSLAPRTTHRSTETDTSV